MSTRMGAVRLKGIVVETLLRDMAVHKKKELRTLNRPAAQSIRKPFWSTAKSPMMGSRGLNARRTTFAMKKATGARALRTVIEGIMMDVMFDIPSDPEIAECTIDADTVREGVAPRLERRDVQTGRQKSA